VAYFTASPLRAGSFANIQERYGNEYVLGAIGAPLKLVKCSPTRWTGLYDMLMRKNELKEEEQLYWYRYRYSYFFSPGS
jgi:hypothetical protein